MIEQYSFIKSDGKGMSFAKVELQFAPSMDATEISVSTEVVMPIDRDAGEYGPDECPAWFVTAVAAIQHVANMAASTGATGQVRLRKIIGSTTDTGVDAVACAATFAALRLLLPSQKLPAVSSERPWRVLWRN